MRFTKPAWVAHTDTSNHTEASTTAPKHLPIFSVHVHPDGSRIATGGMDAKVRIWSTRPILSAPAEHSGRPPKSLCTLTMHTGPVLTVRWAHSGRWLATGSDDQVVMIWDLDPSGGGKVWGSDEVNVEGWKPMKRLPGHESDVTDVAWAPQDRYLASVGLDSAVLVWCGYTLERLHKITLHQGFVKGVCWDPVGEFLATQSDDRSVKIWRTSDWGMEAEVTKPFEDSPGSTFFRRLSWSPDGAHITASNATNNKGFVFIAAVIARNTWTSEISLVGHENTVEVAAYNPHIFLRNAAQPIATANICSVVALGADDRSVSVWQTKSARPLIVAKEVFERSIMDLSWSWDGLTLYAVSSDGTIGVFSFDKEELEGIAPFSAQEAYLKKFGFTADPLPKEYAHPPSVTDASGSALAAPQPARPHAHDSQGEVVNKLIAKRKDKSKKRIGLAAIPSAGMPPAPSVPSASAAGPALNGIRAGVTTDGFGASASASTSTAHRQRAPSGPLPLAASHSPVVTDGFGFGFDDVDMDGHGPAGDGDMDVPIVSLDTASPGLARRRKTTLDLNGDEGRAAGARARTLGGDRPRDGAPVAVREIAPGVALLANGPGFGFGAPAGGAGLPVPPLLTYVSARTGQGGSEALFEGRNPADGAGGASEVVFVSGSGKTTQWLDYLPAPAASVVATGAFCAVAMLDGSVNVYSHTGRRLLPTLSLGSPCAHFSAAESSLMALTSAGMLYAWNVKKGIAIFPPISVSSLLAAADCTLVSASVRPNGAPILQLSTGVAHSYDVGLAAFVKLSEKWWIDGSDAWQGRQRGGSSAAPRGVVAAVEQAVTEVARGADRSAGAEAEAERPSWWSAALTLGHLETKMHAARVLESPAEYKQALLVYAQRIASEGFRGKAEEVVKELFGPVYWRPGRDAWCPTVLGLVKRDLLKDVLNIFARSKTLTKLALDWQDLLKKAATDD